jgi:GntR family transcriptional repressor for pyruvate dehydrogenase complex
MKPGEKIPGEIELTELFKVGRSSIREAKKILSAKGLIESHPGKGSFVKQASTDEIINTDALQLFSFNQLYYLYELRWMLEVPILKLAIQRASDNDLKKISETFYDMQRKIENGGEWNEWGPPGLQFHIDVAEATHNPVIIKIYSIIASMIIDVQKPLYERNTNLLNEVKIHKGILDCLINRDVDSAEKVMEQHFNHVKEVTTEILNIKL